MQSNEAFKSVLAHLVAAVSLLSRAEDEGVKPSKAVASNAMFRQMIKDYDAAILKGREAVLKDNDGFWKQRFQIECAARIELQNSLSDMVAQAQSIGQHLVYNAPISAFAESINRAQKVLSSEDSLRSKPDYHTDPIDQLAFELAFELEEADLSPNDYVTVNRAKLRQIAQRVINRQEPKIKPLVWQSRHGEGFKYFFTDTALGRFGYGVDKDGQAYHHGLLKDIDHASEEEARLSAEAEYYSAVTEKVSEYFEGTSND